MITATDDRAKAILQWLTNDLNLDITQFETASSDASFRRYFRVQHQQHYIVMDAPPDKEDTAPFIKVAQLFAEAYVDIFL
jgi:aminoglycoside/choline kinase family phosphotransferase